MSSNSSSTYTSSSYTSYSTSSSSSTNPQGKTTHTSQTTHTTPEHGTTITQSHGESGRPTVVETTRIPASNSSGGAITGGGDNNSAGRIEDVTESDADREYLERMEDEYAKREGGA